uniref:Ionotropic glutamate receptor C-terminal domain-containing protein n=2 Tax=Nelumbo nucifera TaxID=4432 RepID=A0A822ZUQ9_NELNU|nr:TPA_asm: hypothetical protein HUJ06_003858 [Nelumbo nucifera]
MFVVFLLSDLIKDVRVKAIILGPQTSESEETDFLVGMGNEARIPIFSVSPFSLSLSPRQFPYFVRIAQIDLSQVKANIAAIVQAYRLREVSIIHDDSESAAEAILHISDTLADMGVQVLCQRIVLPYGAETKVIKDTLHELRGTSTRSFIVHLSISLSSSFFTQVKKAGMMKFGYLWIATDSCIFHSTESVLGAKAQLPQSQAFGLFEDRWRKQIQEEHLDKENMEHHVYALLWAYDTVFFIATAVEKVAAGKADSFKSLVPSKLRRVDTTEGRTHRVEYSTPRTGPSRRLMSSEDTDVKCPNGFTANSNDRILTIGIPIRSVFGEFVNVTYDNDTRKNTSTGFSIEVFESAMQNLNYCYKYVPFEGAYTDLVRQVSNQVFNAAVGDITITQERLKIVGFTQPYTGFGVALIVPIENHGRVWLWFFKPFKPLVWLVSFILCISKGLLVWLFERKRNADFQGKCLGKVLHYSFSLIVFAQREGLTSNYSRFIINLWMFSLFILVACYNANLTSFLTVENITPTVTSIDTLHNDGSYVGCYKDSFVCNLLINNGFNKKKLKKLSTRIEYANALSNKSVAAIVEEVPYINVFLKLFCSQFAMAGSTIRTGGFGFAFPQNSPLLSNLSGEILRIREGKQMDDIENKYFGHETCLNPSNNITSNALDINDFRAIFITMAAASGLAMFSYFCSNLYASPKVEGNREIEPNAQGNREIQPNAEGNREIQLSRVLQP